MSKYFFEKLSGDNLIEKVAAAFLNVEIIPESKQSVLDNPDAYSHSAWEKAYFDDDDGETVDKIDRKLKNLWRLL